MDGQGQLVKAIGHDDDMVVSIDWDPNDSQLCMPVSTMVKSIAAKTLVTPGQ